MCLLEIVQYSVVAEPTNGKFDSIIQNVPRGILRKIRGTCNIIEPCVRSERWRRQNREEFGITALQDVLSINLVGPPLCNSLRS